MIPNEALSRSAIRRKAFLKPKMTSSASPIFYRELTSGEMWIWNGFWLHLRRGIPAINRQHRARNVA